MLSWADDIIFEADDATAEFRVTVPIDSPEIERIEAAGKVTFTLDRTHIKWAELKTKTRQWLISGLTARNSGFASSWT